MPNHIATTPRMVRKGIAPLECLPQMNKLIKNPIPKITDGYKVAVINAAAFHSFPFIVL